MPPDMQVLVRHIRRMASRNRFAKDCDRLLLERYLQDGNQDAFAVIVSRHVALVAGVCRRVLGNVQDIEDVVQATFLVLARKAGTVHWHDSVANWLHSVAHRLSLRARADAARRRNMEETASVQAGLVEHTEKSREIRQLLDEELGALPEPIRLPLILCYLEGRTRDEAARQCGWSLRTLERRLEKGRSLLRDRLVRRGLDLSVVLLAASLAEQSASAYARLTAVVLKSVRTIGVAGGLSIDPVSRLAETALPIAGGMGLKFALALILAMSVAGVGVFAMLYRSSDNSAALNLPPQAAPQNEDGEIRVLEAEMAAGPDSLPAGATRLGSDRFRGWGFGRVQYSPDGKKLITAGSGGIQVFDSASGEKLLYLAARPPSLHWMGAISADGRLAALGDQTGAHRGVIYDLSTGKKVCDLQSPEGRIAHLACFSPNGELLAAFGGFCVDLYNTATGKLVQTIKWDERFKPERLISPWGEIGFLPDGQSLIVSVHHTGIVRLFDVANGKERRHFEVSPHGIAGMALSPDGNRLVALPCVARPTRVSGFRAQPDESVVVLDVSTGKKLGELLVPRVSKIWLAVGSDNKTLFAGNTATGLGIWNLDSERQVGSLPIDTSGRSYASIAISPDGKMFAYARYAQDPVLHQINIATGKQAPAIGGHIGMINAVAVSPNRQCIATGDSDGKVILRDRASGRELRQLRTQPDDALAGVQRLCFGEDGNLLFIIYSRSNGPPFGAGTIRAIRVADGVQLWQGPPFEDNESTWGADADSQVVVHGDEVAILTMETVGVREAKSGKLIRAQGFRKWPNKNDQPIGVATAMNYSKGGDELLIWSRRQLLWRGGDWRMSGMAVQPNESSPWNSANEGRRSPEAVTSNLRAAAFSPDGKLLALGGEQAYLQILSVETGKEVSRIARGTVKGDYPVQTICFAPDSHTLAWLDQMDRVIHMGDARTGATLRTLPPLNSYALSIAFTPDGRALIVGCADSTAIVWDLEKAVSNK
jgi:RNA polymerase sigma factor (sigma-70 family)